MIVRVCCECPFFVPIPPESFGPAFPRCKAEPTVMPTETFAGSPRNRVPPKECPLRAGPLTIRVLSGERIVSDTVVELGPHPGYWIG